eukprot:TRINITY_DN8421_c0_g1_i1.p2 TRINITY_DN8421_c0_g1~~TRINITY_DN8421_c0_g1_i1.p2  ORF type:complete len:142 (+),score=2.90 TRINITY_DN8421_c0_g1_i1:54-428(+)
MKIVYTPKLISFLTSIIQIIVLATNCLQFFSICAYFIVTQSNTIQFLEILLYFSGQSTNQHLGQFNLNYFALLFPVDIQKIVKFNKFNLCSQVQKEIQSHVGGMPKKITCCTAHYKLAYFNPNC